MKMLTAGGCVELQVLEGRRYGVLPGNRRVYLFTLVLAKACGGDFDYQSRRGETTAATEYWYSVCRSADRLRGRLCTSTGATPAVLTSETLCSRNTPVAVRRVAEASIGANYHLRIVPRRRGGAVRHGALE